MTLDPKMRVDLLVQKLREQVAGSEISIDDPILALSSWFIDVKRDGTRVTIEYAPELDLFGLCSQQAVCEETDEVYRDETEVLARARELLEKKLASTPGRVSLAAYEWAQQQAHKLGLRRELRSEFMAVVQTFESRVAVTEIEPSR
jgi:hypothetical protein